MRRVAGEPYRTPMRVLGVVTPFGVAWIEAGDAVVDAPPPRGFAMSYFHLLARRSELIHPHG